MRNERLQVISVSCGAHMGMSTLHNYFRALTAMSPLQYQKQLRLHAARGRMLMDAFDAAGAAFEAMKERVSSTASTNASSANYRCATSKHDGSPALPWLATDSHAELHSVRMVNHSEVGTFL